MKGRRFKLSSMNLIYKKLIINFWPPFGPRGSAPEPGDRGPAPRVLNKLVFLVFFIFFIYGAESVASPLRLFNNGVENF
mgnify:CR=1 FL=1